MALLTTPIVVVDNADVVQLASVYKPLLGRLGVSPAVVDSADVVQLMPVYKPIIGRLFTPLKLVGDGAQSGPANYSFWS